MTNEQSIVEWWLDPAHFDVPTDVRFPLYLSFRGNYHMAIGDAKIKIKTLTPVTVRSWSECVSYVDRGALELTGDVDVFRAWALLQGTRE